MDTKQGHTTARREAVWTMVKSIAGQKPEIPTSYDREKWRNQICRGCKEEHGAENRRPGGFDASKDKRLREPPRQDGEDDDL